jgi:hypothetical protein
MNPEMLKALAKPEIIQALISSMVEEGQVEETISTVVNELKPVAYMVLQEIFQVFVDLNNNDDFFAETARYSGNIMRALEKEGFSRDEAMTLLLNKSHGLQRTIEKMDTNLKSKLNNR